MERIDMDKLVGGIDLYNLLLKNDELKFSDDLTIRLDHYNNYNHTVKFFNSSTKEYDVMDASKFKNWLYVLNKANFSNLI